MDLLKNKISLSLEFLQKKIVIKIIFTIILLFSSGIEFINNFTVINIIKNLYMLLLPIPMFFIMIKKKQFKKDIKDINFIFFIICIYSFVTVIWSKGRMDSFKNSILLTSTTIIAMYVSKNISKEDIFETMLFWCFIIIIINLLGVIFKWSYVFDLKEKRYSYVVKGIFKHRNMLGFYMNITISLSLWYILSLKENIKNKKIIFINLIGAIILLYLSRSMTSIILCLPFIVLIIFTRYRNVNKFLIYATLPLLLVSVYVIIMQPLWYKSFLHSMGRNSTLTNRVVIWNGVIKGIKEKPFLGFGYTAFWIEGINKIKVYGEFAKFAHNGFLELLIDFGLVGIALFSSMFINIFYKIKTLNEIKDLKDSKYLAYVLSYLVFLIFYNLIESQLIRHLSITYILIILLFNITEDMWSSLKKYKIK